jgi:hypothetical protein
VVRPEEPEPVELQGEVLSAPPVMMIRTAGLSVPIVMPVALLVPFPMVEVLRHVFSAPIQAGLDPIALPVEVAGDALALGTQMVGPALVPEAFGVRGASFELLFNAVALAVEAGIDAVAAPFEMVGDLFPVVLAIGGVISGQCGRCNGQAQGGDCQDLVHGTPPRSVARLRAMALLT